MPSERPWKTPGRSTAMVTLGLLLWFTLSSLAAGYVAAHSKSAVIERLLDGLKAADGTSGLRFTD
jgi:hypothetical protein